MVHTQIVTRVGLVLHGGKAGGMGRWLFGPAIRTAWDGHIRSPVLSLTISALPSHFFFFSFSFRWLEIFKKQNRKEEDNGKYASFFLFFLPPLFFFDAGKFVCGSGRRWSIIAYRPRRDYFAHAKTSLRWFNRDLFKTNQEKNRKQTTKYAIFVVVVVVDIFFSSKMLDSSGAVEASC